MDVRPEVGLPVEVSVWLTGRETAEMLERFVMDCQAEVNRFAAEIGAVMSVPVFTTKQPGEDRVPLVPDHISGPAVRLLICEATIVHVIPPAVVKASGFVHDLDARDLARLRKITRRAYAKTHPGQPPLNDAECDAVIERVGPESALKTLRGGVDSKALH